VLPKKELFLEAGNCNLWQEVGKSSLLAHIGKPKLHIKLQSRKPTNKNSQSCVFPLTVTGKMSHLSKTTGKKHNFFYAL
jgi:hypothetical protein